MKELEIYIVNALRSGRARDGITTDLLAAGWQQAHIDQAFATVNATPNHQRTLTADQGYDNTHGWYLFMRFLSYIMLFWSVIAFVVAAFGAIDIIFADTDLVDRSTLRNGLAHLIVVAPFFGVFTFYANRFKKKLPQVSPSSAWRSFVYVLLGIFTITFISMSIGLLTQILAGNLVSAGALKLALTIGVIAFLFMYFFGDIKESSDSSESEKDEKASPEIS